jgi:hypothetical protein
MEKVRTQEYELAYSLAVKLAGYNCVFRIMFTDGTSDGIEYVDVHPFGRYTSPKERQLEVTKWFYTTKAKLQDNADANPSWYIMLMSEVGSRGLSWLRAFNKAQQLMDLPVASFCRTVPLK